MVALPFDQVPDEDIIEPGFYRLRVAEAIKDYSADTSKLMVKIQHRLTDDNPNAANRVHYENYVLGTLENPDPAELDPNVFGVRMLVRLFRNCGLPVTLDLDQAISAVHDKQFDAKLTVSEQKDGPYAGRKQSRIVEYFPPQSKQLGLLTDNAKPAARTGVVRAGSAPNPTNNAGPSHLTPAAASAATQGRSRSRLADPELEEDGTEVEN